MNEELFTVARFYDETSALILKGRLEAEDIPVYMIFENMHSSSIPSLNRAVNGITVKVPFDFGQKALDIYFSSKPEDFLGDIQI